MNSSAEIASLIEAAVRRLQAAGIESAQLDAQVMLTEAARADRAALLAGSIDMSAEIRARFADIVSRHEPVAYIVSRRTFYSLEFEINRDVLVPRRHTEALVEVALAFIAGRPSRVLEIGTGSGPIAVTIAVNAPHTTIVATDISYAALQLAGRNAIRHRVADRIQFVRANLFSQLDSQVDFGLFDLIVSDPPNAIDSHIASLERDVREYEPRLALAGGPDGLGFFRHIAGGARNHLTTDGLLVLEIGRR